MPDSLSMQMYSTGHVFVFNLQFVWQNHEFPFKPCTFIRYFSSSWFFTRYRPQFMTHHQSPKFTSNAYSSINRLTDLSADVFRTDAVHRTTSSYSTGNFGDAEPRILIQPDNLGTQNHEFLINLEPLMPDSLSMQMYSTGHVFVFNLQLVWQNHEFPFKTWQIDDVH